MALPNYVLAITPLRRNSKSQNILQVTLSYITHDMRLPHSELRYTNSRIAKTHCLTGDYRTASE